MSPIRESSAADASNDFEPVPRAEQPATGINPAGQAWGLHHRHRHDNPETVSLEAEAHPGHHHPFAWGHAHGHPPAPGHEHADPPLASLPPHPPPPPHFGPPHPFAPPFGPGLGFWVQDTIRGAAQQFGEALFGPPGSPHHHHHHSPPPGPGSPRHGPGHIPGHPPFPFPPHWGPRGHGPHGRRGRWGHGPCGSEFIHPPLDIVATEDSYTVSIELPGLKKKDVDITVNETELTISGEFKTGPPDGGDEGESSGSDEFVDLEEKGYPGDGHAHPGPPGEGPKHGFVRRERRFGKFKRVLRIPPWVNADDIKATMAEGVLTITVKKKAEEPSNARKINIL